MIKNSYLNKCSTQDLHDSICKNTIRNMNQTKVSIWSDLKKQTFRVYGCKTFLTMFLWWKQVCSPINTSLWPNLHSMGCSTDPHVMACTPAQVFVSDLCCFWQAEQFEPYCSSLVQKVNTCIQGNGLSVSLHGAAFFPWLARLDSIPVFLLPRVVKEEISDDNAKLPCFNGRVVSWVSEMDPEAMPFKSLLNPQLQTQKSGTRTHVNPPTGWKR